MAHVEVQRLDFRLDRVRVWGLGFGVWGLGFRVEGLGWELFLIRIAASFQNNTLPSVDAFMGRFRVP